MSSKNDLQFIHLQSELTSSTPEKSQRYTFDKFLSEKILFGKFQHISIFLMCKKKLNQKILILIK